MFQCTFRLAVLQQRLNHDDIDGNYVNNSFTVQLATFFHINCGLMIRALSPSIRGEEASMYK